MLGFCHSDKWIERFFELSVAEVQIEPRWGIPNQGRILLALNTV